MITNPGLENHIHRATDIPLLQHTTHRRHAPILALPCLASTLPRSATCSPCLPRLSFFLSSRRICHVMPTHVRHPPLMHVLFLRFRILFSFRVILYASCLPSFSFRSPCLHAHARLFACARRLPYLTITTAPCILLRVRFGMSMWLLGHVRCLFVYCSFLAFFFL